MINEEKDKEKANIDLQLLWDTHKRPPQHLISGKRV